HGAVTTQTQTVGNYLIEFEYTTLGTIHTDDFMGYQVYLLNPQNHAQIKFDSVYMSFKFGSKQVLYQKLASDWDNPGLASMRAVLSEAGEYTVNLGFYKNNQNLVFANFKFNIEEAANASNQKATSNQGLFNQNWIVPVISFVAGGIVTFLYRRLRKKK